MKYRFLTAAVLLLFSNDFVSQTLNKSFTVNQTTQIPEIDGVLDELIWETAEGPNNFQQYFPSDSVLAENQTNIKMLTDGKTLYIAIKVNSLAGNDWVIPSLRRDYRAGGSDSISLLFDTFNDGTNAFMFGINPYGVRREALISGGGRDLSGFTTSWDVKWKGESKRYNGYYTAEIAIPLTSFKFKEGETKWRFQSYSFDAQSNERSVWQNMPQNQLIISLAFMGDMHFEKPLGKSRTPLAIIPYLNTIADKDFDTNTSDTNFKVGGDAKVAIGNGLNLDITINPDFSNVEVDNIVTNLTRFEIGLPERRQFFVDNNDLFGSFGGATDSNPFFSRRIGIASDLDGNTIENDILGGIRLSGKLNEDWRLGILSIQTDADIDNEIASNNNTMFALQKKVFSRSNISLFFVNRETFNNYDFLSEEDRYNRVIGADYNLSSLDNKYLGKAYIHKSFQPGNDLGNYSIGANIGRLTRSFNVFTDLVFVDEEFTSDLGFIRRNDIIKSSTSFQKFYYPKSELINNYSFQLFPVITWRPKLNNLKSDQNINASAQLSMQNSSEFNVTFANNYTYLTDEDDDFEPTGSDGVPLPNNAGYHYNLLDFSYRSNRTKVFSYNIGATVGHFYNGEQFSLRGDFALRLQPKASISLALNYDKIELPDPFSSANIWLISPKFDITFSKSIFWSTLVQYSNQNDNLGVNSRLQWRFAPLSDLFIVYNDNYYVNQFSPKYRSINLKLTYWLNI